MHRREISMHADADGISLTSAMHHEGPLGNVTSTHSMHMTPPVVAAPAAPTGCSTQESHVHMHDPRASQRDFCMGPEHGVPSPAPPVEQALRLTAPAQGHSPPASNKDLRAAAASASAAAVSFEPQAQTVSGSQITLAASHAPAVFDLQLWRTGVAPCSRHTEPVASVHVYTAISWKGRGLLQALHSH